MTKKKRIKTVAKSRRAHKVSSPSGPKSIPAEHEPLHQPDYLLEDHPELGIPSVAQKGGSPKQKRRAKK
jgi:hypothetical protein